MELLQPSSSVYSMPTVASVVSDMPAVTPAVTSPSTPMYTSNSGVTMTGTGPTMIVITVSVFL